MLLTDKRYVVGFQFAESEYGEWFFSEGKMNFDNWPEYGSPEGFPIARCAVDEDIAAAKLERVKGLITRFYPSAKPESFRVCEVELRVRVPDDPDPDDGMP
jgi:hypothetical protein